MTARPRLGRAGRGDRRPDRPARARRPGYTAWLQRQQVRAQVWPYLQVICYCSALDECWLLDEREEESSRRRRAMDACPAGKDEFIDNKIIAPQARPPRSQPERI